MAWRVSRILKGSEPAGVEDGRTVRTNSVPDHWYYRKKEEKYGLFGVRHQRREDLEGLVPGFDCCCLSIDVVRRWFAAM